MSVVADVFTVLNNIVAVMATYFDILSVGIVSSHESGEMLHYQALT